MMAPNRDMAEPQRQAPAPAAVLVGALSGVPHGRFRTCQWITSQRSPWAFCGAAAVPGRPYCDEHCSRVYARRGEPE